MSIYDPKWFEIFWFHFNYEILCITELTGGTTK